MQLADAILDDEAFACLPDMIASRLGGRSGLILSIKGDTMLERPLFASHFSPDVLAQLLERGLKNVDIWLRAGLRHGVVGKAYDMEEFVPEEQFRASELRNEILLPNGDDTGRSMGIFFPTGGDIMCLSVHRPSRQQRFDTEALSGIESTAGELARVLEVRAALVAQRRSSSDLRAMVGALDEALLLVDRNLRTVEVNLAAERLLHGRRGITLRSGRLAISRGAQAQEITHCVAEMILGRAVSRSRFLVPDQVGVGFLCLALLPLPQQERPLCMVRLSDPTQAGRSGADWLRQQYGTSRAEAAVAEALMEGLSPAEIAESRGVSLPTVRTQIRQVLEKTGSGSILALQRLLSRLP